MSPISQKKKCPVCAYATRDISLNNCPECGTELTIEVLYPRQEAHETYFDMNRNLIQSELRESEFRNKKIEDQSWQMRNYEGEKTQFPLYVKKEVNLYPVINIPKLSFTSFRDYKLFPILLLSLISIFQSLTFVFALSNLQFIFQTINLATKIIVPLLLLILNLFCNSILSYYMFKLLLHFKRSENVKLELIRESSFKDYIFLNFIQLTLVSVIFTFTFFVLKKSNITSSGNTFSHLSLGLGLLFSLPFLLVFRVAKILATMRKTGLFQHLYDSIQFSKFSLKRRYGILFFSLVFPLSITLLGLNYPTKLLSQLYGNTNSTIRPLTVILCILLLIAISAVLLFSNIEDMNILMLYETYLYEFSVPPSINWLDKENSTEEHQEKGRDLEDFFDIDEEYQESNANYCTACSSKLPDNVDYCVICGNPVK